jgi:hypothetical protein
MRVDFMAFTRTLNISSPPSHFLIMRFKCNSFYFISHFSRWGFILFIDDQVNDREKETKIMKNFTIKKMIFFNSLMPSINQAATNLLLVGACVTRNIVIFY